MIRPVDADTRERLAAERERNVVIEASAGTGKTTLLVDRVRALLKAGIELDRLCVVTFTEAAASELRSRLRSLPEAGPAVSRAWIHTIHAFAGRVLREYSHITGVDPDFRVCPSRFSPVETGSRWDRYVAGLAGDDLDTAWGLIRTAGKEYEMADGDIVEFLFHV